MPSDRPLAYAASSSLAMPGPACAQIGGLQEQLSSNLKLNFDGLAGLIAATSTAPGSASAPSRRRVCGRRPTPLALRPGSG